MLGYILIDEDRPEVLARLAQRLCAAGLRLSGAVQIDGPPEGDCACDMDLHLLHDESRIRISQSLGGGASGCRLDAGALEEATAQIIAGLAAAPDLVVLSKFSRQEAAGRGLRAVMAAAVEVGLPVLTTVSTACLPDLLAFAEDMAEAVPLDGAEDWAVAQTALRRAAE